MSDDNSAFGIFLIVVIGIGLWYDKYQQEIQNMINSFLDTIFFLITCIAFVIGAIMLVIMGYYGAQYINERY